jgi:hypothetical protein
VLHLLNRKPPTNVQPFSPGSIEPLPFASVPASAPAISSTGHSPRHPYPIEIARALNGTCSRVLVHAVTPPLMGTPEPYDTRDSRRRAGSAVACAAGDRAPRRRLVWLCCLLSAHTARACCRARHARRCGGAAAGWCYGDLARASGLCGHTGSANRMEWRPPCAVRRRLWAMVLCGGG